MKKIKYYRGITGLCYKEVYVTMSIGEHICPKCDKSTKMEIKEIKEDQSHLKCPLCEIEYTELYENVEKGLIKELEKQGSGQVVFEGFSKEFSSFFNLGG